MSYTNSFYDPTKVKQYMEENTYMNQYVFHVPGNGGATPGYVEDPHVRLTKWGANRWTNNLYIEDQLNNRGRTHRRLRHDYTMDDLRENIEGNSAPVSYPTCPTEAFETRQSRAEDPPWTLRDRVAPEGAWDQQRHYPLFDPQARLQNDVFPGGAWSRNEFKDAYMRASRDYFIS